MEKENPFKEYYQERYRELNNIRGTAVNAFDKAILQLASGGLAVTIAFLDKIGKPNSNVTRWLLYSSWICFLLVITLNLLGFLFAKKNMDFKVQDLGRRYREACEKDIWPEERFSCYRKATEFCTEKCLWLFLLATILFVIYAISITNHA